MCVWGAGQGRSCRVYIDYVRTMTIVLRTVGAHNKVTMGRYMIKSGSEGATLLCGEQTVMSRVDFRMCNYKNCCSGGPCIWGLRVCSCHLEILLNISLKFVCCK